MEFADIKKIFDGELKQARIHCWLHNKRSSGGVQFLIVRDGTEFIQCTLKKSGVKNFDEIERLPSESVLEIEGEVRKDERAPGGYEIVAKDVKILSVAQKDFPITKKAHGVDYLLDNRHLWIRSKKIKNIMTVRAKLLETAREWFKENGFLEVQVPTIVSAAVEGGSTLFEVKYFDTKAYLTQSWQLYGEAVISGLGKCYTIAPSFRAEFSRTRRHLTEYWHMEAEMPFCDMECLMKIEEELLTYIAHKVAKECEKELKELKRDSKDLMKVKIPFPRITYGEALKILDKKGVKIKYGDRLGADEEDILTKQFDVPFFVTHFPKECAAFYHKRDPKNPNLTLSVDMYAPGCGEIFGSGQRIDDFDEMVKAMKEAELKPENYSWYLDLLKWGAVEHSGFGMGVERVLTWICSLKHIRDAILFPRFINRIKP